MDSLAKSINQFALEFSKKLAESAEGKNIFFSPWGISTSLAMVYLGAKGTTAAQMAQVSGKGQSSYAALKQNVFFTLHLHFSPEIQIAHILQLYPLKQKIHFEKFSRP